MDEAAPGALRAASPMRRECGRLVLLLTCPVTGICIAALGVANVELIRSVLGHRRLSCRRNVFSGSVPAQVGRGLSVYRRREVWI